MLIAFLELVPVVVAAHLWGASWSRLRVQFFCDNMAVVCVLNSGTSGSPDVIHLLRLLTLAACRHNFVFSAAHPPGRDNAAADALSRLRLQEFQVVINVICDVAGPITELSFVIRFIVCCRNSTNSVLNHAFVLARNARGYDVSKANVGHEIPRVAHLYVFLIYATESRSMLEISS
jgi:hypothetical protein